MASDLNGYIEYLQMQLATDQWECVFDAGNYRKWFSQKQNVDRLKTIAKTSGFDESMVGELEKTALEFEPLTKFDHLETQQIFAPVLERVKKAAVAIGLEPVQDVMLVSSPGIGVSPAARPQTGMHLLFIGRGTSAFCNYWAKAICQLVFSMFDGDVSKRFKSSEDVSSSIERTPSAIFIAVRLAIFHAFFGTLIGFEEVVQPPGCLVLRTQLLTAMESFVVAHEYAHFVAEEGIAKFKGQLTSKTSHELEMFCDELGLQICREIGNQNGSFFEFTGVGAIIFLRVVELCESVTAEVEKFEAKLGLRECNDSHPEIAERIDAIKHQIRLKTALDQKEAVDSFVEEYDCILSALRINVLETTRAAMGESEAEKPVK